MTENVGQELDRAIELIQLGRDQQAIALLVRLMSTHPEKAGPIELRLALAHLVAGRPEQCLEHAQRAIQAMPDYYGGYLHTGIALYQLGRPEEAVQPLQAAAGLEPDDSEPLHHLALVLTDLDRGYDAFEAASEALRRDPQDASNHFAMGYVLQNSDRGSARRAYLKTLELDPQHSAAKHNLALLAIDDDDWDSASEGLAAVLAENPQAQLPVYALDQRITLTIFGLNAFFILTWCVHWVAGMLFGLIGSGGAGPAISVVVLQTIGVVAGVKMGTQPLEQALPGGGRQYFAGFPRRHPVAAVWMVALFAGWLWTVGVVVSGWVVPERPWPALWVFLYLVACLGLGVVQIVLATKKTAQLSRAGL